MEEGLLNSLKSIPLNEIVKSEYRTYQIYTLMDRAIPYLQDGLKPGQRRILYTLWKNKNKGLIKVSAATGMVLTLHPHGPASIESTIVNLAQDYTFSNNYPLIDKKGYFGERMENSPAAGRYIECKIGKIAELILFDDFNQVEMVLNFDEKAQEPVYFLPKLPIMLLNGAEGIGTGFSSVIPSFHHKDIINSMIGYIEKGKAKKLKPHFHNYDEKPNIEKSGKIIFNLKIEKMGESYFITEIPRNYDATRIYRFLGKFIENGYLKDFIDSSVNNEIKIELIFKRGGTPSLSEVQKTFSNSTSMVPNYTLISERGIMIFKLPEQIIEQFTNIRLSVVKRRYELRCIDLKEKIKKNSEIIRFIKEKHYITATKSQNRKSFIDYLRAKKFIFSDYLADMPIYKMTKDEVARRTLFIKDDKVNLKKFDLIAKSKARVKKALITELRVLSDQLNDFLNLEDKKKKVIQKDLDKVDQKLNKKTDQKALKKKTIKKRRAKKKREV